MWPTKQKYRKLLDYKSLFIKKSKKKKIKLETKHNIQYLKKSVLHLLYVNEMSAVIKIMVMMRFAFLNN